MTDRERLLQILNVHIHPHLDVDPLEAVTDYLLDNGVTFAKDTNVPSWIPVSERLPNNCKKYLCLCNVDGHTDSQFAMVLRYYLIGKKPHFQYESDHGLRVTHWMPLPEPPKEDTHG